MSLTRAQVEALIDTITTGGNNTALKVRDVMNGIQNAAPNTVDDIPSVANSAIIYVNKAGNDTTGTGTILSPYLTVTKALAVIAAAGDASATKPYVIDVGPGVYAESFAILPWTFVRGYSTNGNFRKQFPGGADVTIAGQTIVTGNITASSTFSGVTCYYGVSGVTLPGSKIDINLYDIAGAGKSVGFFRCCYAPTVNNVSGGELKFNGRGVNQDIVSFESVFSDAGAQFTNGIIYVDSSLFNTGMTVGQSAGITCDFTISSSCVPGNMVMFGDASDASKVVFSFFNTAFGGVWIQHDYATLNIDSPSFPKTSQVTLSANFTTTLQNDAFGVGYTPTTPSDWNGTPPSTIQQAIDRLAAASSSPP